MIRRALLLLLLLPLAGAAPAPVMTVGRLHYDGGGDWYANPSSLPNLIAAIRTRTGMRVGPAEKVVTLAEDELWNVPYIYMTGHGNVRWSDQDLATLRRYLLQGGFLHADDNYGMDARSGASSARLFPDHPLVEVPLDHPIYHLVYDFPKGFPRSTSTTASRPRASASSSTAGWRSTTPTRATSATGGRISRSIAIRRRSTRPRSGWV